MRRQKRASGTLGSRWRNNPGGMLLGCVWRLFRALVIFGICFILLYPMLYTLVVSFRPAGELMDPSVVWVSKGFTFDNLARAARAMLLRVSLPNTVFVCMTASLLQVLTCMATGYGFARFRFREKNVLFALVILTMIVPQQAVAIPMFLNFRSMDFLGLLSLLERLTGASLRPNILDTPYVYFLPALLANGLRSGFFIFIFRQFFKGLPRELADSGYIDGCNAFETFARIMAPNALPAILTVFLFSMVWYWNEYFYPQMYMKGYTVISTALGSLKFNLLAMGITDTFNDPYEYTTLNQAAILISIAPMLLMYIVFQRYFIESVERTGIVG